MKRNIIVLFTSFLLLCSFARAQYVDLPDSNFRNNIRTKWPGAFNASGQMDTSYFQIVTANQLVSINAGIKDLTGIKYFKNITGLLCSGNQLTNFPAEFPPTLTDIFCDNNQFAGIPILPAGLITLSIYNNHITAVNALPASLKYLTVNNNPLTVIDSLPPGLLTLSCAYANLKTLPALPSTLETLYCNNNDSLNSLPLLPFGLNALVCNNDNLPALPVLSATLKILTCNSNVITCVAGFTQFPD